MLGTMKTTVKMLGVYGMQLEQGQTVRLSKATNLPKPLNEKYFAAPANGKWSDGVDRSDEDSILISTDDVSIH